MPKARRGELWMADPGFVAKVRPVLILSVDYRDNERAVVTCVLRTASVRGTHYGIPHIPCPFVFALSCRADLLMTAAVLHAFHPVFPVHPVLS